MTRTRIGFTLLELLICFAILAVLIGLILSAVSNARLSALRTMDANRMRQIGVALNSYAAQKDNRFPKLFNIEPGEYTPTSLQLELLPFIGHESLYRHWHSSTPIAQNEVDYVSDYVSSLDPTGRLVAPGGGELHRMTYSSFAGNYMVFGALHTPRINAITDGQSNTIFFTQHYSTCGIGTFSYAWIFSNPWINPSTQRSTFAEDGGYSWVRTDYFPVTTGDPAVSDSLNGVTFQTRPRPEECDPKQPNTGDPTAMLTLMGDGRVIRIHKTTHSKMFWAAVTPNKGESGTLD